MSDITKKQTEDNDLLRNLQAFLQPHLLVMDAARASDFLWRD